MKSTGDEPQDVMDLGQTSGYLGLKPVVILELCSRSEIPYVKLLSSIRFSRTALDMWAATEAKRNVEKYL